MIVTSNLTIRPLRSSDRELIDRHLNNAEVLRFLGGRRMFPEEADDFFDWLQAQQRRHGFTFWPVERRSGGEFLGLCGLVIVDEPDSTVFGSMEIGWRFRIDVERRGAATEAARACFTYAVEALGAQTIVSRTVIHNDRSWALMERIGLQRDPTLDYETADGDDLVVYKWARNGA